MDKEIKIEEHIARTIFGSMLMVVLIIVILFNEEHQIIAKSQKVFGFYIYDFLHWGLISISFLIFFIYSLPSIVYLIKKIIQDNDF